MHQVYSSSKRFGFLLTTCLFTAKVAVGQSAPDYLVTTPGDTLRGRVQLIGKNYQKLNLTRPGQPVQQFSAAEVLAYGNADGVARVSRLVGPQGAAQLLTPVVTGYVSLFSGQNTDGELRFYLQPADSAHVVEIAPATPELTYLRILPGCSSLAFGYGKVQVQYPYNRGGLTRLVNTYNACVRPQQASVAVKNPFKIRPSFGLKIGANASRFQLASASYGGEHQQFVGYQAGATLNLATRTRFSVQLEAVYLSLRSRYGPYDVTAYNTGIPSNSLTTNVQYSQVQLPLLLRYTFGNGLCRPYLNAGPAYGRNFSNKSTNSAGGIGSTVELPAYSLGGVGGLGLVLARSGGPVLGLEARYDYMVGNKTMLSNTPIQQSARLDLSVTF
ncbi:outer membrane beta-barrel protein [Hymenobacter nivis]|uniref:outer membrane beta-barrel protein n=1 Tax=Hymenobacter nivis TaxID=1850093 RepID=UPI00137588D5|nr:outer membrane beta-barrel protein [Hymenobacter nivis]